jgi:hypothetical protein
MINLRIPRMVRSPLFWLFLLACGVLVAEGLGEELIPTPKRRMEAWWPVLSDCSASISEEQLTEWAARVREGEWIFGEQGPGKVSEVGVVVLGDGQKVGFCFVSHHQGLPCLDWDCVDSLALFRAADLEIRTIGGFCCEVGFSTNGRPEKQPKDLMGFVRLLAGFKKAEIVNRRSRPR